MFDKADTSESGHLSLCDLRAALCRVDPNLDECAVADIMAMLDLDGDRTVSFEEVRSVSAFVEETPLMGEMMMLFLMVVVVVVVGSATGVTKS